jgi:hypothetical protein
MDAHSILSAVLARGRAWLSREEGTAVIEFVILVVLLIMPMVYLIVAIMQVQAGSFAATQAVREAGRAFAQADSLRQATTDAKAATGLALADQGFEPSAAQLAVGCGSGVCLRPGSIVTATVSMKVRLPFVPDWLAQTSVGSIPITATHESPIDVYRTAS